MSAARSTRTPPTSSTSNASNTGELYASKQRILEQVRKRHESGSYDHAKAWKLWLYWVDAAAKRYQREIGPKTFSKATREALARELADRYRSGEE